MGQWIKDLAAGHRAFADQLAERQSMTIPSEDPDYGDLGLAFPAWTGLGKDAILQPPKPEIRPSAQVLQRAAGRDADWRPRNDSGRVHAGGQEVTAMAATGIPGAGPSGVLRLTWVQDQLAHVLEHCEHRRAARHLDRPGLPRSRAGPRRRRGHRHAAAAVRPPARSPT